MLNIIRFILVSLLLISAAARADYCEVFMNKQYVSNKKVVKSIASAIQSKGYIVTKYGNERSFGSNELHVMMGGSFDEGGFFSKKCTFKFSIIRTGDAEIPSQSIYSKTIEMKGSLSKCQKEISKVILADKDFPVCVH